jgi:hypothetical protein
MLLSVIRSGRGSVMVKRRSRGWTFMPRRPSTLSRSAMIISAAIFACGIIAWPMAATAQESSADEGREIVLSAPTMERERQIFLESDGPNHSTRFENGKFRLEAKPHQTSSGLVYAYAPNNRVAYNARYEIDVQLRENGGAFIGVGGFRDNESAVIAQSSPITRRSMLIAQHIGTNGIGSRETLGEVSDTLSLKPNNSDVNTIGIEVIEIDDGKHMIKQFVNGSHVQESSYTGLDIKQWGVGVLGRDALGAVGFFDNLKVSIAKVGVTNLIEFPLAARRRA